MAIKVEGVITTATASTKQLRSVKSLRLTLNSQLQNPAAKVLQTNEKLPDCNQTLEHTVEPHNDFFSTQFLLPFAVPGTHQVSLYGPYTQDFLRIDNFFDNFKSLFLVHVWYKLKIQQKNIHVFTI